MNLEKIMHEKWMLIGRVFLVGASVLGLIGAIILAVITYNDYIQVSS